MGKRNHVIAPERFQEQQRLDFVTRAGHHAGKPVELSRHSGETAPEALEPVHSSGWSGPGDQTPRRLYDLKESWEEVSLAFEIDEIVASRCAGQSCAAFGGGSGKVSALRDAPQAIEQAATGTVTELRGREVAKQVRANFENRLRRRIT
jgi:hypothetical protein